jgi:hypothetical protein
MAKSSNSAGALYQALMRHFLHQDHMVYMSIPYLTAIQTATIGGSLSVGHTFGAALAFLGALLTSCYLLYVVAARADRDVNIAIMDELAKELIEQTNAKVLRVRISSEEGRLCGLRIFWLIIFVVALFIAVDLVFAGWLARG